MNSQVFESKYENMDMSNFEKVSSSALNETFHVVGEGYFHFSSQPHIATSQEALLLDRYIYDSKGEKIAQRVKSASLLTHELMPDKIVIPEVVRYGSTNSLNSNNTLAYWVDNEVHGVNAKLNSGILTTEDYKTIIDWIIAIQSGIKADGISVGEDYDARIKAFNSLIEKGYYENSISRPDTPVLNRIADSMAKWNDDSFLNQEPVFKHGDLHIANILKMDNKSLAIIDFEASAGGPGDNLKDIMKLLHMDYVFFDVQKSREGAFLSDAERMLLLDYYILNSKSGEDYKLREPAHLLKRIALDSLTRYVARLTLASLQGDMPTNVRIQRLMRDMTSVTAEMTA